MHRLVVAAVAIVIASGCAGGAPKGSPAAATLTGATPPESIDVPPTAAASLSTNPVATAMFAGLGGKPAPDGLASSLQEALDGMVVDGFGIAATVMTADGTWSGAAGMADGIHDLEPDSQFGIASGTKPIIAAQTMQFVESGELLLDAPATDYLPSDFTFDTNGATIRQLLGHRSGIPDWYSDAVEREMAADRNRAWDLDEVLGLVEEARRSAGSYEYADTNYNLLGLVIETVSDRPLIEVLRDGVLRVDGTDRLIYQPNESPTGPMAMPNGESSDAFERGGGYLPSMSDATTCGPACAVASDSISLARWWRAFCAGQLVSPASLTEMAAFDDTVERQYGLGLTNPARGLARGIGHLGANFGYISSSGCLTEAGVVYVVLTNDRAGQGPGLATPLLRVAIGE